MKTYILDGYNVIYGVARLERELDRSLQAAREALVRECVAICAARGDIGKIYVVFDGSDECSFYGPAQTGGVVTVFTHSREEADERIVSLLRECPRGHAVCVVSADNYVQNHARAFGVSYLKPQDFFALLTRQGTAPKTIRTGTEKAGLSNHQESNITAEYRRHLGL
ncbi:MAG: NYN domain-containing protein [Candidatus Omnitrophota bacterium]|jgi:predicted RNA-binding protein with PIN domain